MKVTLELDVITVRKAMELAGIRQEQRLINLALKELIVQKEREKRVGI